MPEKPKQKRKASEPTKKDAKKSRSRSAPAHSKANPKLLTKTAKKSQKQSTISLQQIAADIKNLKTTITDNTKTLTQSYASLLKSMPPLPKAQKPSTPHNPPQPQPQSNPILLKALAESIKSKAPTELRYQLVEWIRQHYGNKHANELMEDIGLPTPDRKNQSFARNSSAMSRGNRRSSYRLDGGSALMKRAPSPGNKSSKGGSGRGRPKKLKSEVMSGGDEERAVVVGEGEMGNGKLDGDGEGEGDGMGRGVIGDDMIPQVDNESVQLTMQMSMNNDGGNKAVPNFFSEAGSQN
jgi:hypothetical protein